MRGLIAPLERKNGWTLAEEAGHGGPDRIHRLLNGIDWDADEVLDDVRNYVVEHLGHSDAVLIVDDTGFHPIPVEPVRGAGFPRRVSRPIRISAHACSAVAITRMTSGSSSGSTASGIRLGTVAPCR
ncbi:hypothetical protein EES37_17645 [Streptomyces sp. ADI91-18]|nr:hypothetical protein EES37_17645 [Streptomyces sp. ADI91-18]